ncbi:MAG TPA: phosphoribosylformylglycinamidine cyclo-ligase [Acidimicrobiales bacterium]|nr:phosphoribosylformylglycinamidine cyclo-ligase [Acidimicrobiales bacterium]
MTRPLAATYAAAGVDVAAGDAAVRRIASSIRSSDRPGVLSAIGGFAGRFSLREGGWRDPILVAATDGVGTKLEVAREAGVLGSVGTDLVAMCVDDLACTGAAPIFFLDYLAVGVLDPDRVAELVAGIDAACLEVGCALLGGETAEHPGTMAADQFDLAGFAVGVVERDDQLGPDRVRPGDALVALASGGLRSNGYSLARHLLFERAGRTLTDPAWEGADRSVRDVLLEPSVLYSPHVQGVLTGQPGAVHAAAHVTGGGLALNLARALPQGCGADVDRSGIAVPRIFTELQRLGDVADAEMATTFNLGVGMVLVVDATRAADVAAALRDGGVVAAVAGTVTDTPGIRVA